MTKHKTVIEFLKASTEIGALLTCDKLLSLGYVPRVDELIRIFRLSCGFFNDAAAAQYFEWIMQALEDLELSPFFQDMDKMDEGTQVLVYESDRECWAGRNAVAAARAKKAITLWGMLPSLPPGTTIKAAAMKMTREAILAEIAARWSDTKDEPEADELFTFLAEHLGGLTEESSLVSAAIKKVTDRKFPVSRLTKSYLQLSDKSSYGNRMDDILSALAATRTRNLNSRHTRLEFSVLQYLDGATEEAFHCITTIAQGIKFLDDDAVALKNAIQPSLLEFHGDWVEGEIRITYPDSYDQIQVLIDQRSPCGFGYVQDEKLETCGHQQFELARDRVVKWKETHADRRVVLALEIWRDSTSAEPVFRRTQQF